MKTLTPEQVALINKLREETGAGMLDCRKALYINKNDYDKALLYLRENRQHIGMSSTDTNYWKIKNRI